MTQVWQAEENEGTGVWVNLSLSNFPFPTALQSRLGAEHRQRHEVGMRARLVRGWAPLAAASVTGGCRHQGKHRIWGRCAPQNSPQHAKDAQGFTESPGCPYPSKPVSLKINLLRSALLTGVRSLIESSFLRKPHRPWPSTAITCQPKG